MKPLVLLACMLGWAVPAAAETILDFAWTSETFIQRGAEAAPAGGTVTGRGTAVFDPAAGVFLFEAPGQPGPLAGGRWGSEDVVRAGADSEGRPQYSGVMRYPAHPAAAAAGHPGEGPLNLSVASDGSVDVAFRYGSNGEWAFFRGHGTPARLGAPEPGPGLLLLGAAAVLLFRRRSSQGGRGAIGDPSSPSRHDFTGPARPGTP